MRAQLLELLYETTKVPYQKWFKKDKPWDITVQQLLRYPTESLGFHLGSFLLQHDFSPQPKLENHDVFHVLTGIGISVPEEIAMQYYLWGNGKQSIYGYTVILLGTCLFPDKIALFRSAYQKGKNAFAFHDFNYQKLLKQPLQHFQKTFSITAL